MYTLFFQQNSVADEIDTFAELPTTDEVWDSVLGVTTAEGAGKYYMRSADGSVVMSGSADANTIYPN